MVFNWFRRKFDNEDGVEQASVDKKVASEAKAEETPDLPQAESSVAPTPQSQDLLNWAKAAYVNIQKQQVETQVEAPEIESEPIPKSASEPVVEEAPAAIAASIPEIFAKNITELVPEPVAEIPEVLSLDSTSQLNLEAIPEAEIAAIADSIAATTTPESETAVVSIPEPTSILSVEEVAAEPPASAQLPAATAPIPELVAELPAALSDPSSSEPSQNETAPLPFWMQSDAERLARIAALEATAIAEPASPQPVPVVEAKAPVFYEPQLPFDEGFIWSSEVLAAQGRRPEDISAEEITWLKRLRQGLGKTRLTLVNQLKALVGQGPLSADDVDSIEALLLQADVGVQATDKIVQALQTKLRDEVVPPEAAIAFLKQILREMLDVPLLDKNRMTGKKQVSNLVPEKNQLNIWLITGVNGAGKTTTIGKLAHTANKSGYKTLIAAADTFRAAAVQQVQAWGDRAQVEVIANTGKNTDPAAVVFDAIIAAQARGSELLLIDTAGRLQNKNNLMDELSKIRRIVDKKAPGAVIESLLVLDSTLGQNGLRQAEVFSKSAGISGVVLTKLDGTAKGGVAIAVVQQLGLPIRFIGAGEGIEDLRPFSSYEFVEALLSN
jgi:fused signal recognition particle receptor